MQGIVSITTGSRRRILVTFLLALCTHLALFALPYSTEFYNKPIATEDWVNVQLTPLAEEFVEIDRQQNHTPNKVQPIEHPPVIPEESPTVVNKGILLDQKKVADPNKTITVPYFNHSKIQEFVDSETAKGTQDPAEIIKFADSFQTVEPETIESTIHSSGTLGGGNYKVVHKNRECEVLKMVPLSFDDLTQGTSVTSGNCRDLKPKIDLSSVSGNN